MIREMSNEEFNQIRDYIYIKSALYFDNTKKDYLEKRIILRMTQLNILSYIEYYYVLKSNKNGEFNLLAELITTNETYFFRNLPQLNTFSHHVLPEMLNRKAQAGDYKLTIWSAGCSSGEEPYTLAMILKERIEYLEDWDITILGTDISNRVLNLAEAGEYFPRSLMETNDNMKKKYFAFNSKRNTYSIHDDIKNMVKLKHLNLNDDKQMSGMRNIDLIFCRNVLIYFDDSSRKRAVEGFYDSLKSGGYIVLGHAESILRITKAFEMLRMGDDVVFRKELD